MTNALGRQLTLVKAKCVGVVKWFDPAKGFGYITREEGEPDIFVHFENIISKDEFKYLQAGQNVEFVLFDGPKGLHAIKVKIVA